MEKPAVTDHRVHELVRRRWSPRSFLDKPVEPEKLHSLFEAARWAPSCFNEQPWRFLVARREDPDPFQRMLDCLTPGNQAWAAGAGALILSVAARTFARNGKPNLHAFHDVGLATAQLVLQATAEGLGVHQMAGFDRERARGTWQIPDGFDPVAVIAVGYRGEPDRLPSELREREVAPRVRRPQREFVFSGGWDQPA
jgi:nitroreductase